MVPVSDTVRELEFRNLDTYPGDSIVGILKS